MDERASPESESNDLEPQVGRAASDLSVEQAMEKMGLLDPDDDEDIHVAAAGPDKKTDDDEAEEGDEEEIEELPGEDDELEDSAKAESDEDGAAEDDEEKADELDDAYATLLGLPKAHRPLLSDLKNMPRAKLIAWAKRVEEATEAKDATPPAGRGRDATGSAKGAASSESDAATARAAYRARIAEKLGLDEDAAEVLMEPYDTMETLRAEQQADKAAAREREGRATIDAEVRRLSATHPELKTDKALAEKLVAKATALVKTGEYQDARDVFNDAAKLVLGPKKRTDLPELRRRGSSPSPERNGGLSTPLDETSYYHKAIEHSLNGRPELISRMRVKTPPQKQKPRNDRDRQRHPWA